jgi:hypothetical protein
MGNTKTSARYQSLAVDAKKETQNKVESIAEFGFLNLSKEELENITTIYMTDCPEYILVYSPLLFEIYHSEKNVEFNADYLFCRKKLVGSIPTNNNHFRIGVKVCGNYDVKHSQFRICEVGGVAVLKMYFFVPGSLQKFIHMQDFKLAESKSKEYMKFKK